MKEQQIKRRVDMSKDLQRVLVDDLVPKMEEGQLVKKWDVDVRRR